MNTRVERVEDRLADFTRDKRIIILSLMAIVIGMLSAVVAKLLVWLIAIITNLVFFQKLSADFVSPTNHHLRKFVILAPVAGGLVIGLPDEILYEAIDKMVRNDIGRLPVVSRDNSRQPLGYLGRAAVMTARLHRMKEEHEREPGWLQGLA